MIQKVSIKPYQIQKYSEIRIAFSEEKAFPLLGIDYDSYMVEVEIQSGINFNPEAGRHCILIGKACSLADNITFMIDLNHDYESVTQGTLSILQNIEEKRFSKRKGTILIQNDVWIGHGVKIMGGVTLHNGCVVAAGSVVTKDVPPYAIVGGNPATVLRYRFNETLIAGLQKIAWWNWSKEMMEKRKEDFLLPVKLFVSKYLDEAEKMEDMPEIERHGRKIVLFIPDIQEPYPLYPKVFEQYFEKDRTEEELLIYIPREDSDKDSLQIIKDLLKQYESCDSYVTLQTGVDLDERLLFQWADYFVTTRSQKTIERTCLADLYGTKILYGTDEPIFYF